MTIEFSNYTYIEFELASRNKLANEQRQVEDLERQLQAAKSLLNTQVKRHDFISSILFSRDKNNLSRRDFIPQKIVDNYNHHIY